MFVSDVSNFKFVKLDIFIAKEELSSIITLGARLLVKTFGKFL